MGKYILLITVAATASIALLTHQANSIERDTDYRQAERQEKVIARQIARSGYNMVLARARVEERNSDAVDEIVSAVGTVQGQYQGGAYRAWLTQISPTAYRVTSEGTYNATTHRLRLPHERNFVPSPPEVDQPSELEVEFIDSMAGYCSAIFLQRFVPKNNKGHGNNADGDDSDNASSDDEETYDDDEWANKKDGAAPGYKAMDPELIFAPGNNRNGAQTMFEQVIEPGTLLNFVLAVDADYTCEERGNTAITLKDKSFDYTRMAFQGNINKLSKLSETPFALTQEKPSQPGTWRVAFEDLVFSNAELWEVKERGYEGNGWMLDLNDYWKLKDYGDRPDFSDQVIEVQIVPADDDDSDPFDEGDDDDGDEGDDDDIGDDD